MDNMVDSAIDFAQIAELIFVLVIGVAVLGAIIMFVVLGFIPAFIVSKILAAFDLLRIPPANELQGLDHHDEAAYQAAIADVKAAEKAAI